MKISCSFCATKKKRNIFFTPLHVVIYISVWHGGCGCCCPKNDLGKVGWGFYHVKTYGNLIGGVLVGEEEEVSFFGCEGWAPPAPTLSTLRSCKGNSLKISFPSSFMGDNSKLLKSVPQNIVARMLVH